MTRKTIQVDPLTRVEGEGALDIVIENGSVAQCHLRIFEPPRFFESLLRGRHFSDAPDVTARICGICPVAYQISAVQALEDALGVQLPEGIRQLRRLLYCGEWIESHALHVFMLHAPDFHGFQDAIEMARRHPEMVERGLALKKAGNQLVAAIGGREIHPVNVRVGGFYKIPSRSALRGLLNPLRRARDIALETVRWTADFDFPDLEREYEFVSLSHPSEYPIDRGRIVSSAGLDIPVSEYRQHFEEFQVPRSHALHSRIRGRGGYLVGPMARFNLNFDRLLPSVREAALEAGVAAPCRNPFQSIVVRALETLQACQEAVDLIENHAPPERPFAEATERAGEGFGCSEAPRGLLYHHYRIGERGEILEARIVPPTAQNQTAIEEDLRDLVSNRWETPNDQLTWLCEQGVRNYDPCISCATHFLRLHVERRS